jgi:hypothetical protein
MRDKEVYLGDGLYASFDGFAIWLRAPRENGVDHVVALEPQVWNELAAYHARLMAELNARRTP